MVTISLQNKNLKREKTKNVLTIGRYFKNKFGHKVYKVPISIGGFYLSKY